MNKIEAALLFGLLLFISNVHAQDTIKKEIGYKFTPVIEIPATPIKDQYKSGTCWAYSSLSFIESEMIRMGILSLRRLRLKSLIRLLFRNLFGKSETVDLLICPVLFLPLALWLATVKDFSGVVLVISSNVETVIPLSPGVVGL